MRIDSLIKALAEIPPEIRPGRLADLPGEGEDWTAVYDLDQASPQTDALPGANLRMCADCAYRPNSPERQGDERHAADADMLDRIVRDGEPFWCHQGIRQPVTFRCDDGIEIPAHPGSYDPPIVDAIPYKADGTPADLCAGWLHRRATELRHG